MQISPGKVVSIDYTLTDDQQKTIDTSAGGDPLAYIHGSGQIIPGLEKALDGKTAGDVIKVKIPAAEGYGTRDDAKKIVVGKDKLQGVDNLAVGMQLHASGPKGQQVVTVTKIDGDQVTLDANHPLAGVNLNFDVTVREVRDATKEELDHGHVHGPGGHHH